MSDNKDQVIARYVGQDIDVDAWVCTVVEVWSGGNDVFSSEVSSPVEF